MSEKQFEYYEEENGEFPIPYIKTNDGRKIMILYECYCVLNNLVKENLQLKNDLKKQFKAIAKTTDEFNSTIDTKTLIQLFKDSNELKEIKNGQLCFDKMDLIKILRNHYLECQKWNDTHTQLIIKQIAQDLKVDLE